VTYEDLEQELGAQLPGDFRSLHDGSCSDVLDGLDLMGVDQIADEWRQVQQFADDPQNPEPEPVEGVKEVWWSRRWIPFGLLYGSTDFLCLDLDPAADGALGQVIHASPKRGPLRVVSQSYTSFREWLTQAVRDDIELETILG
jgi:cell wall assembly regulator SMI1